MLIERRAHPDKIKKTDIPLTYDQRMLFKQSLHDFLGKKNPLSWNLTEQGLYTPIGLPDTIQIHPVNLQKNGWTNPLFNILFSMLSKEEQTLLTQSTNALADIGTPFILAINTEPHPEIFYPIQEHARVHHHGVVPYTRIILEERNQHVQNGETDECMPEDETLAKIREVSAHTLEVYALTKDPAILNIVKKMNEISNPFEVKLQIGLVIEKLQRSTRHSSELALGSIPVAQFVLEHLAQLFGDGMTAQVAPHAYGEFIDMLLAMKKDIIGEHEKSNEMAEADEVTQMLGLGAQSIGHLSQKGLRFLMEKGKLLKNRELLNRLSILGFTTATAMTLAHLSNVTGNIGWYAAIAGMNTFLITAYEIRKRAKEYSSIRINSEQLDLLIKKISLPGLKTGSQFYNALQKHPGFAIALAEFCELNTYGVGNVVGAVAATASVWPMKELGVPNEVIFPVSGYGLQILFAFLLTHFHNTDAVKDFIEEMENKQKNLEQNTLLQEKSF